MPSNRAGKPPSHRKGARPQSAARAPGSAFRGHSRPGFEIGIWIRGGLIVLAGVLAYSNSLAGPFVNDDYLSIVSNRQILGLWPLSSVLFPARELPVAGRPLVNLSLAVNYAIGGLDVRGFHLVNIAIHLLCGLALFGVVRRTLNLPSLHDRFGARSADLAFACALVWVLHPLQTETVNYLTQRTESMMALFYLLTLYGSIRATTSPSGGVWQAASVVSCALGMACKESMVTAPVVVVLYDWAFVYRSLTRAVHDRWRLYLALAATWVELGALMWTGPRLHSAGFTSGAHPWTYLLNQTVMITEYLRHAVWPRALVFDYGVPLPLTLGDVMPYAVLIVALLLLTVGALRWRPMLGFLGAWFFITLSPSSSVVPIATEVGAERRMYLPLAALVVLVIISMTLLWDRFGRRTASTAGASRSGWAVGMVALLVISTALAAGTIARNREYASAEILARTVLERWPQSRAHRMLAVALLESGRRDEALAHLREAIPDDHRAYYSLGLELFNEGKLDESVQELQEFIRLEPTLLEVISARETIGLARQRQGRLDEAAAEFRTVLQMTPNYAAAHHHLADVLFAQQKFAEAGVEYQEFLKSRPRDFNALTNLGISEAAVGHTDESLKWFRLAVDVEPDNSSAHRNLANTLLAQREFDQAAASARKASALDPRDPVAHDILGLALASQGRHDDAIAQFQLSLQLNPDDAEVREHLALARQARELALRK